MTAALDTRSVFSAIWNQYLDCTTPLTFSVDHDGETFTCHTIFKWASGSFDFSCLIFVVNEKNFINYIVVDIPESKIVNKKGPFIKNDALKESLIDLLKKEVLEGVRNNSFYSPENHFWPHNFSGLSDVYVLKVMADYEPYYYKSKGNIEYNLETRDLLRFFSSSIPNMYRKQSKKSSDLRREYLPSDYDVQLVPDGRKTNVILSSRDFFCSDGKTGLCIKGRFRPFRDEVNDRIIDVLSKLPVNWEAVALLNACLFTQSTKKIMEVRRKYIFFTDPKYPNRMFFLKKFYGLVSALTYHEVSSIGDFIDDGVLNVHELARFMNKKKFFRTNISGEQILKTELINDILMSIENNKSSLKDQGSRAFLNYAFVLDFYLLPSIDWLEANNKDNGVNQIRRIGKSVISLRCVSDSWGDVKDYVPVEVFTYMVANDLKNIEFTKSLGKYLDKVSKTLYEMEKPHFITSDLEKWMEENLPMKKWKNAEQTDQSRFHASLNMMNYFFEDINGDDNTHIMNNCPFHMSNSEKIELLDWLRAKYAFLNNNLSYHVIGSLNILVTNLIRPLALFLADKESDAPFSDNKEYRELLMTVAIKVMVNQYKIGDKTTFLEFCERLRHLNLNKSKLSATVLCHTSKETAESVLKMFSGYIDQKLIDGGPEGFLGINDMYKAVKMLNPEKRISRPVNLNVRDISGELDQFNYLPHERSKY